MGKPPRCIALNRVPAACELRRSKQGQPFGKIPTPFCVGGVVIGHTVNPGGQVVPGGKVGNVGSVLAGEIGVGMVKMVGKVNNVGAGVTVENTKDVEVGPVDGNVAP